MVNELEMNEKTLLKLMQFKELITLITFDYYSFL